MCLNALSECYLNSVNLWCHDHFPGQPVPVLNHYLAEELFPHIQLQPPLTQLHTVCMAYISNLREKREVPPLLWGGCRPPWVLPSVSSLDWTNQRTSGTPHMSLRKMLFALSVLNEKVSTEKSSILEFFQLSIWKLWWLIKAVFLLLKVRHACIHVDI